MRKTLTPSMKTAIELITLNPTLSRQEIADMMKRSKETIVKWYHSDVFKEALEAKQQEMWKDAARLAQARMVGLLDSGKEEIQFKASQYVLDSNGYKPKDKVELKSDVNIIKVSIEDEPDD